MTTAISRTPVATTRQSQEFTLTERVISEHINSVEGVDALRFTDTANALHYTAFVNQDGEYVQADFAPQCFDLDDLNQHVAPLVAAALNEYCQVHSVSDGLIAVNPDNSSELLLYRY